MILVEGERSEAGRCLRQRSARITSRRDAQKDCLDGGVDNSLEEEVDLGPGVCKGVVAAAQRYGEAKEHEGGELGDAVDRR
jgi:hypothetical protein